MDCPICLEHVDSSQIIYLPCFHFMDVECYNIYINCSYNSCPLCEMKFSELLERSRVCCNGHKIYRRYECIMCNNKH